jgi:hypothetical protein
MGTPAYMLSGTYQNPSSGLQRLMEIGTIIGDKAYVIQYIADAPKYSDYLPTVQKMIDSLVIKKSLGTGIETTPDNSTNLHPYNLKSVMMGYVMSCGLDTQKVWGLK